MELGFRIILMQSPKRRSQVNGIAQEAEVYDYDLPGAPGFFVKRGKSLFQGVKAATGFEFRRALPYSVSFLRSGAGAGWASISGRLRPSGARFI